MGSTITQGDITAALQTITSEFSAYQQDLTNKSSSISQNTETRASNTTLELKLRELKRQQETLDKQFLDASEVKKPATVFQRMGLSTFEDWALVGFFVSAAAFCLVITGSLMSLSSAPVRVAIFGILLTGFLLGIAFMLIRVFG